MPAYLDSHDNTAGHVLHLVHHPVRSSPELRDLLQVIGLHHKVLDGGKEARVTHSCRSATNMTQTRYTETPTLPDLQ